jgi:flagellar basal body-associated protein FliL
MKSKRKLIIIIAVVVFLLSGIGAGLFFFLKPEEEIVEDEGQVVEVQEPEKEVEIFEPEVPLYLELKPFTTTIGREPRHAKITMQLKMGSEPPRAYLTLRTVQIKDAVIAVLQKTESKEVNRNGWVLRLKERIIKRLNKILPEEPEWEDPKPIRKVLFSELIVQ